MGLRAQTCLFSFSAFTRGCKPKAYLSWHLKDKAPHFTALQTLVRKFTALKAYPKRVGGRNVYRSLSLEEMHAIHSSKNNYPLLSTRNEFSDMDGDGNRMATIWDYYLLGVQCVNSHSAAHPPAALP